MKERAKKQTKTRPDDWIAIQWARGCEEVFKPKSAASERVLAERDDKGKLLDPTAYLKTRADEILKTFGVSVDARIGGFRRARRASAAVAVALGALAFPFARVDTILGDGVNLAGPFLFFLVSQIFFLGCSLCLTLFVSASSLARRLFGRDRPVSFSEKLARVLSSVVGACVLWATSRVAPRVSLFWQTASERLARRKRGATARDAEADAASAENASDDARRRENARRAGEIFWSVLLSKPRAAAFWGGALSHAFWTSCSLCVLLILAARMQANRYDYRWHTSLEDERVVKKGADFLGAPIAALGGSTPSESDVAALFADDFGEVHSATGQDSPIRRRAAATRTRWSYFLLSIVFIWCVVPRAILVGIYYFLYRRALGDFKPDLNDPYYRNAIERAETYCTTTLSAPTPLREDDMEDEAPPITAPAEPIWRRLASAEADAKTAMKPIPSERVSEVPAPPNESVSETSAPSFDASRAHVEDSKFEAKIEQSDEKGEKTTAVAASPRQEPSPEETERARLTAALAADAGFAENVVRYEPPQDKVAIALCYDLDLSSELAREALGRRKNAVVLGDAASLDGKKELRARLDEDGARVDLCVVFTDVGLPPARHFVRFMRETLAPALSDAKIVVVLSGGERMRRKFATSPNAASERVSDWKSALASMTKASGMTIAPVLYYDAELNLPEPRARLRAELSGEEERAATRRTPRDLKKWDAATARIVEECRRLSDPKTPEPTEETSRLCAARVADAIFKLYAEEVGMAAYSGKSLFPGKILGELTTRIASTEVGAGLARRAAELGEPSDFLESRFGAACGLIGKLRAASARLSPKCALAAGSIGLSVPLIVAFAPLLGGAATATAIVSTVGAVGAALPSSLATGAIAGALGALAPEALKRGKRGLVEKLSRSGSNSSAPETDDAARASVVVDARADAMAELARASATWAATLELQGLPEDAVVATLSDATRPFEDSSLADLSEIERAFGATRKILEGVPRP